MVANPTGVAILNALLNAPAPLPSFDNNQLLAAPNPTPDGFHRLPAWENRVMFVTDHLRLWISPPGNLRMKLEDETGNDMILDVRDADVASFFQKMHSALSKKWAWKYVNTTPTLALPSGRRIRVQVVGDLGQEPTEDTPGRDPEFNLTFMPVEYWPDGSFKNISAIVHMSSEEWEFVDGCYGQLMGRIAEREAIRPIWSITLSAVVHLIMEIDSNNTSFHPWKDAAEVIVAVTHFDDEQVRALLGSVTVEEIVTLLSEVMPAGANDVGIGFQTLHLAATYARNDVSSVRDYIFRRYFKNGPVLHHEAFGVLMGAPYPKFSELAQKATQSKELPFKFLVNDTFTSDSEALSEEESSMEED